MNRYLTFVLLALAAVLLSSCQTARDIMANPGVQGFVGDLVRAGVSVATKDLSPEQADAVSTIASSVASSAVDGVTTGQWQWDWDKLVPLGISSIAGAGGLNWWRNKQRTVRGEPTGSSPASS